MIDVHDPSISDWPPSELPHVPIAIRVDLRAGVPFSVDEVALPDQPARIIYIHPSQPLSLHERLLSISESPYPCRGVFAVGVAFYSAAKQHENLFTGAELHAPVRSSTLPSGSFTLFCGG